MRPMFHSVAAYFLLSFYLLQGQHGDPRFRDFVRGLRWCRMPLAIECGLVSDSAAYSCMPCDNSADSVLFARHGFGTLVFGKLFPKQSYVAILAGEVAQSNEATLQTFTSEGSKLDSLFIGGGCGEDDTYWSSTSSVITEDFLITMVDTTLKWNEPKRRGFDPDSTIVETTQYKVIESGKIVEVGRSRRISAH